MFRTFLNHHLYYCEECIYIAHIECVIPEDYTLIADETEQDAEKNYGNDAKHCSSEQAVHTIIKDDTFMENLSYSAEQHNNVEDEIDELQEIDTEKAHTKNCSLEQTMKDNPSLYILSYLDKEKLHDVNEDVINEVQESDMERCSKGNINEPG